MEIHREMVGQKLHGCAEAATDHRSNKSSESEVKSSTKTTTAYLQYKATSCKKGKPAPRPILPQLPAFNDTITTRAFTNGLRSLLKAGLPTKHEPLLHNGFRTTNKTPLFPRKPLK
ncbi:hypothetical protein F8388_011562 [Cannabis sativa]|uniref:Uncharacterized protein n=1 Tax=Cannabis sativa TaxID=3483 RepID=A0A7J6GWT0_CANSA|nr:hypothetical protein F8388_011562 [Cannabis sativa]